MLDFLIPRVGQKKTGKVVYPDFKIGAVNDIMTRGEAFYAIWIEDKKTWSTDLEDVVTLIDSELYKFAKKFEEDGKLPQVMTMKSSRSGSARAFNEYCKLYPNHFVPLDSKLIFADQPQVKENYATKCLPYSLKECDTPGYEMLMSVLYSPEERHKLEWAVGSIVAGESVNLQKFIVLYGESGTGKSTFINIVQQLFDGYCSSFDSRALGTANNAFALEAFRSNPLVAIQHDGDLSRIEDNTKLNSLISHEIMNVNQKFKASYDMKFQSFLFLGTNKPVQITDAKSGLIRRLIDVTPTGKLLKRSDYDWATGQIKFELGGIAKRCLDIFQADPHYYDGYKPLAMMTATNDVYNFIIENYDMMSDPEGVNPGKAYEKYKIYAGEANVPYVLSRRNFTNELKSYFTIHPEKIEGKSAKEWNRLRGFREDMFKSTVIECGETRLLKLPDSESEFDMIFADCPAQYANAEGKPIMAWNEVTTKLKDLDTTKTHYVRVPENHIVIDFDIPSKNGEKDLEANLKAAAVWPTTYSELSNSGKGVHLHYIYEGDVNKLSTVYADHIEIKKFTGKSSLRRRVSKCLNTTLGTIAAGLLPEKGEKKVVDPDIFLDDKHLRRAIMMNLNKNVHANTTQSVQFIKKILDDAYASGKPYDVSDMETNVFIFAANSTNQSKYCRELVRQMKFKSQNSPEEEKTEDLPGSDDWDITFFDLEVFPNLLHIRWKHRGPLEQNPLMSMFNPKPEEIDEFLKLKLVGYNNRRYDNHILKAASLGYSNQEIFELSQSIINTKKGDKCGIAGSAGLSYTDVYDFLFTKQSLKKWEIQLGLPHMEFECAWDEPLPKEKWPLLEKYCGNDVLATEAVFDHNQADWKGRKILAHLANMSVNTPTSVLTGKIIFGDTNKHDLCYTDLATGMQEYRGEKFPSPRRNAFPGYEYKWDEGKRKYINWYKGEDVGRGGLVRFKPGMYTNVKVPDVESMHPTSAIELNIFGDHTKNFQELKETRLCIKHKDYEAAKHKFGGRIAIFLTDDSDAKDLSHALKIAINQVYGMTSSVIYDTQFTDKRNKNNIVALRGALFMSNLAEEVEKRGFEVVHIKTDSFKVPGFTDELWEFVQEYGAEYGYKFEIEDEFEKFCLVNGSTYIGKTKDGVWHAKAEQFAEPYVFKTLFSKEPIEHSDLKQIKETTRSGPMYILNGDGNKTYIGKIGAYLPMKDGYGGDLIYYKTLPDGTKKACSVNDTKDYKWLEYEQVEEGNLWDHVDMTYFANKVDEAREALAQYGDVEWFVS